MTAPAQPLSATATAFMETLPSADELMPALEVRLIEQGDGGAA